MALLAVLQQIPGLDTIVNVFLGIQYLYNLFKKVYDLFKKMLPFLRYVVRIFFPIRIPPEAADYETLPITINPEESESIVKRLERLVTYNSLMFAYSLHPWSRNRYDNRVLECTICLQRFGEDALVLPLCCNHIFHATCFYRYLMNDFSSCPLCNRRVRY